MRFLTDDNLTFWSRMMNAEGAAASTGGEPPAPAAPAPATPAAPAAGGTPTPEPPAAASSSNEPAQGSQATPQQAAAPSGPPDAYTDFTIPEGVELPTGLQSAAQQAYRAAGLSQEQAQVMFDLHARDRQLQVEAWQSQVDTWKAELKNHPKLGGEHEAATTARVGAVIAKHAPPSLLADLERYGLGSHPGLVEFVHNIAVATGEDPEPASGGQTPGAQLSRDDQLKRQYPNSPEMWS